MVTLKNGNIVPSDFMNEIFLIDERQKLTNLAKVVAYKVPSYFKEMSPDFPCSVKVIMKNGSEFEKTIGDVKGGLKRPMSINDLKIKFLECNKNNELFDLLLNSNIEKNSKFIDKFF